MRAWGVPSRLILAIVGMAGVGLVVALVLVGGPWRPGQAPAHAQPEFQCPSDAALWGDPITLTPDSGLAGSSFVVGGTLSGAGSDSPVEVIWDWDPGTGGGQLIASGHGPSPVSLSAAVPGGPGLGDHEVTVCWEACGGEFPCWGYSRATFHVTEPETPTPTEETPTPTPGPTEEVEPSPQPPATQSPPTPSPTPPPSPRQMLACPEAGKWGMSLWEGPDDTEIGEALAACGEGAVDAAYLLDPDTQQWSRWIDGRPDVSNLSTVDDLQVLMLYGGSGAAPGEPGLVPFNPNLDPSWPNLGQMVNCPDRNHPSGFSAWVGPNHTPILDALGTCPEPPLVVYHLDPVTSVWDRWIHDRPDVSTLEEINNGEAVITTPDPSPPTGYIVVTLLGVQILDNDDPFEEGEIEIGSIVTTGEGKTQKTQYPNHLWVEANDGDWILMNQPIFALKESEMGDNLAMVVTAVDDDSYPGWASYLIKNFTGPALGAFAQLAGAPTAVALAIKEAGNKVGEDLAAWLGVNETIGTFTNTFRRDEDWGVWEKYGSVADTDVAATADGVVVVPCHPAETSIYEAKAKNMIVRYTIHRRQALDVPVTVTLEPIKIEEDGDTLKGDVYIWARVADAFSGELYREDITRIPATGDQTESDGNYHPDNPVTLFTTDAAGPFVYVEVGVWDADNPWMGDDDDSLGISSWLDDGPAGVNSYEKCRTADAPGNGKSLICIKFEW